MALPTPKQLLSLAKACRKAGIVQFKGEGIEFTLTDSVPVKTKKSNKDTKLSTTLPSEGEWDNLSELDKLLWSSAGLPDISTTQDS